MKTYPLLQSQLGVLLESMQHPESTQYNLPNYIFMPLELTMERIVKATQTIVDSFPELHTRFVVDEQGDVRQWPDMQMPIPVVSRRCTEAELQAYISEGFVRPFSLFGAEPLFRVEVVETEQHLCLLSDGHHAIIDGMSFAPILTTAFATVLSGGSLVSSEKQITIYQAAEEEATQFGTERYQQAKAYYAQKFAGQELATLSKGKSRTMGRMYRCTTTVGRSEVDDWCREHGTQANLLFQAAFSHVLSVLTRQEQVAYAAVNHGRMDKRLRSSVGMFVKSVPILVDANPSQTVVSFVKSLRGELMSTIRYGIYPFTHFCSDLGMKPGIIFDFMAIADMEEQVMLDGVMAHAVQPVRKEIDSDMSVDIYLRGENYEIRVQSSLAMNDEATLRMVAEAIRGAVVNMMGNPELTLGELELVSDEERDALVQLGTGEHLDIDPTMTFVKAFEQCASRHPDNLAVADAKDGLTYGELSRRSDILAHRLIESGVKPNDFVAVMLPRTIDFPLAVIAIHKAGAAYVPIDLDYPEERKQYMLDHSQAKLVIDSRFISETDFVVSGFAADNIDLSTPEGLAYMIYTSGSTGRPKGVMIRQANLWNFIQNFSHVTRMTAEDRVSAHRSFSFDAHLKDLYAVLVQGGSLHIMPEHIRRDLHAIRQFIIDNRITVAGFTTTLGMLVLNTFDDLPIRLLNVGGERLHDVYSDHIVIVNCYGPTECTDDFFFHRIEPGERLHNVPIGRPVSNGHCFLIDTQGRLVPRGAVGELCFAGVQVASGYWRQPELTAEKFTDCPFLSPLTTHHSPLRMYHTGDLCRWNVDGLMEYVGRKDDQVKLRGFRIEFGEVENRAAHFEGICQAVAVIKKVAGSDTLCLYYTANHPDTTIDANELRRFMAQTLADYMVPAAYMQLDTLPLTPSGKVDRRRLPDPSLLQEDVVAPASELEQQLFDIVARQLGTESFGVTTDLVTIGMSSLDAMRLSLAISQQTGLRVSVNELLEHPTIRYMAETVLRPQTYADTDLAAFHREQDSYPLTENQRGIYIDWELNRDTTQYNVPVAVCLGQQDADGLAEVLRQVVDAHSYIKTRLARHEGNVVQLRRDNAPVQVSVTRLDSEPDSEFFQQRVRPFDLYNDDLYRLEIYTYGGRTWLFRDIHHIMSDGLSSAIFFRDMLAACQGTKPQAETVTAFDFALYEQQLSSTSRYDEARDYFDDLLAGTEVASYPRSSNGSKHESQTLTASINDSKAVRKACRRIGITPNSYFQTVVAQVLHSVTRQQRLMLATVSNGRSLAQTQNIVGMFVKTLPMVSEIAPDGTTFSAAAQAMHRQSIQSLNHDFYPLTEMVERHGLRPEILYVFESGIYDNVAAPFSSDTEVIVPRLDTQKLPIEVLVNTDQEDNYTIQVNYDAALYSRSSMEALAGALTAYAAHAVQDGILLGNIELTTSDERAALVELGAGKYLDVNPQMTFVKAFEACASKNPDCLAVADATDSLTYGELSRRSDVLAHRLIASGVKPGDFVAVMLDRTIAFPLAVIAIHKAGAAYVPIDLEYPEERQRFMLEDCGAKVVIDSRFLEETDLAVSGETADHIDLSTPDGPAYMIYTSGSTGKPKGAVLHQAGLWNFIQVIVGMEGLTAADRIAIHRSFSFDAHVEDLFPVLTVGGSLHIMPSAIRLDLNAIRRFLLEHQITGGGYATAMGKMLLETFDDLPMRITTLGGEKLTSAYSDHITIINVYGPTECTDDTSYYIIEPGRHVDAVPIGRPVANGYYFLVDPQGRLVPRGAVGELCFAGIQVGLGYWQQPELTASVFTDCPFLPPLTPHPSPVRMYHTGDLGRWNDEGQMEYIGRKDAQVKLRGYRIELGEIEACATRFDGIAQAVAVIRPLAGSDALCLYYTTGGEGTTIDTDELRQFLGRTLADYMVPVAYMQLDALPLTPNGKVDRRRLPGPSLLQEDVVAPASEMEQQLFDIVARQLGTEAFGVTTDLVTIGMSSLDAMRLSLAISQQTGLQVYVSELLEHPTIRYMAEMALRPQIDTDTDLAAFHREQDSYPLTENQRGIYIDWELNRDTTQYNVPVAVCLGQQDADGLAEALRQVVDAHSYIKTRLARHEGSVVQLRRDNAPVQVSVTRLDSEPDSVFFQQRVRPFDLFNDNLYRLEIYTYGGRTWLFRDIHHIVCDGLSSAIFFRDMLAACQGTKPQAETVTAFDFALYEQQLSSTSRYEEARNYFDNLLAGAEVASYPQTLPQSLRGGEKRGMGLTSVRGGLDSEAIRKACRRIGITPNSYFQTVVAQVLHSVTRQQRLMLATVSNGRSLAQTQNIVGMFVKTLPMVSEIAPDGTTFSAAAQAMHRQSIQSMNHDFYPLTEMVEHHGLRPEILYVFEGGIYDNVAAPFSSDTEVIVPRLDTQKMPIEVMVNTDQEGNYTIQLNYDAALYAQTSMEALAGALTAYAAHAVQDGILLGNIELTTDEQREALTKLGCGEQLEYDHADTLVSLFRRKAAATPDATAVVFGDRRMTYGELDQMTDSLASHIINIYGVQPEEAVGVMIDRSELMVVYPLAIMKAGGCYMPLDYSFPADRLEYMCEDAGVRLILSEGDRVAQAMPGFHGSVFVSTTHHSPLTTHPSPSSTHPSPLTPHHPSPSDRFVILYTSGSTGRPKGVALEHHSLVNFCHWYVQATGLSASDRMTMHAAFGFDCHIMEMFPTLMVGATLHVIPSEMRLEIEAMNAYFEQNAITRAFMTTQVGHLFASNVRNHSLRMLCVAGEKLMPLKYPGYRVVNGYGPTEATVLATYLNIDADYDRPNIGRPLSGYQVYVVDPNMRLVPCGVPGELVICGEGVARGYLHPTETDAARFTMFNAQRAYRTGDLVRWADDGNLDFLGRIDNQVKLRGLRIEMGEIEACASRFEGIGQVAAQTINDQYVCLYYTADADVDVNALKHHLADNLAAYMVPTAYMQLDAMPLNANGKIDRRQLPEPSTTVRTEGLPPHTEKEAVLLLMAQHVLGRDDFGITDDLFDLGLTSITVIKVATMAEACGVHVSVNNLMRARTIERVFSTETPVGYWFNTYSPEKPVLISPHGVVPVISMTEKFREWQDHFSIYTLEPTDEHAARLSPDFDYDVLVSAYADIIDRDIPADARVFAFLGYSWGGELSFSLATQWQRRHGTKPRVYLCDTFNYDENTPKMSEEQITQGVIQYVLSHASDFDMGGLQSPGAEENSDVLNLALMKCGKDLGFAGEVLKIATKKFLFGELYRRTRPHSVYDGHVTYFVSIRENPLMAENLAGWKKLAPDMEVIEINDNHMNFSLRNDKTYFVTERLLEDLKNVER